MSNRMIVASLALVLGAAMFTRAEPEEVIWPESFETYKPQTFQDGQGS